MERASDVVLVTGGGGGIGRATSVALARAGARVAVVDIDAAAGHATVEAVRAAAGEAAAWQADVSEAEAVERVMAEVVERWGRLDGLVNNAGIQGPATPITEVDDAFWARVLATNLTGCFLCTRAALRVMQRQGGGSVVNVASISGLIGYPGFAPYVASKHGIVGLTRAAAVEVAAQGIRVNAVCPGPVDTALMRAIETRSNPARPDVVREQIASATPMGRYATPDEVAAVVVFLCSDAASYVSGAVWTIDGGITATQ